MKLRFPALSSLKNSYLYMLSAGLIVRIYIKKMKANNIFVLTLKICGKILL